MPHISWTALNVSPPCSISEAFLTLLEDFYIFQHVHFPTRYRNNQVPSLLDLVLTNNEHMIPEITSQPSLGKSDHIVIEYILHNNTTCHNTYMIMVTMSPWNMNCWVLTGNKYLVVLTCKLFGQSFILKCFQLLINTFHHVFLKHKWLNSSTLKLIKRKH